MLDLYAGTGALAFEALSRGASRAVLVDRDRRAIAAARRAATELGLADRVRLITLDLGRDPARAAERLAREAGGAYDLVLADPPYAEVDRVPPLLEALAARGAVAPDALVALEHATRQPPAALHGLASIASYEYGDTAVLLAALQPGDTHR